MKTDTKKLLELCEKATPGPWSHEWLSGGLRHLCKNVDDTAFCAEDELERIETGQVRYPSYYADGKSDISFIVACTPEVVRSLCTELDRALELLRRAKGEIGCHYPAPSRLEKEIEAFLSGESE